MKKLTKILFIAAFLNALSWIVLIPLWQYPDEQAHFAQVQNISELGKNPKIGPDTSYEIAYSEKILQTERDGLGNNKYTYHPEYKLPLSTQQEILIKDLPKSSRRELVKIEATKNPPLYYFLASIPYRLTSQGDLFARVYAVRFLSIILFILLIVVAYRIANELFGKNSTVILALISLIAFKPMLVFSSTGILPDPLTNLFFATVLLISLKVVKKGLSTLKLVLFTIVVILGILTRQQFLLSVPIFAYAIFINLVSNKKFKEVIFIVGFFILFFVFLIYYPSAIPEIGAVDYSILTPKSFIDYFTWNIKHSVAETLPWYWGVYKWLSLTPPAINYQVINRLILLSVVGIAVRVLLVIKNRKFEQMDLFLVFLVGSSIIYFLSFVIGDYLFENLYGYSFGIQGRYYFPLVIAHIALILIGVKSILKYVFKSFLKYVFFILILFMIIFNDISLLHVSTSYYSTASLSEFIIHASQFKPVIFKGYMMLLILGLALLTQAFYLVSLFRYIYKENVKD